MKGIIYCIQMGEDGPVKLGFTKGDPDIRLRQLQTGNPIKLRVRYCFEASFDSEKMLHTAFADLRMNGEWFEPNIAIFRALPAVARCGHIPTKPPLTEKGVRTLHAFAEINRIRKKYPDGSLHSETDWDLMAVAWDQDAQAYEEWRARQ